MKSLAALPRKLRMKSRIFGCPAFLAALARDLGIPIDLGEWAIEECGSLDYPPPWGVPTREGALFARESLQRAAVFCRDRRADLLVTPPVHKKALRDVGFPFPGQTEFVASFFPDSDFTMAFFSEPLCVLLATVHIGLSQVPQALTPIALERKFHLFHEALSAVKNQPRPRIAVCGLNPHASEEGLFGDEEQTVITPVIDRLQGAGYRISGPYPADTLFRRALGGQFEGVVAMYHDQGLIPLKLVAFDQAVNTTLGLPVVRTSPDHGTAYDIAGKNQADPGSMTAAIHWGLRLAKKQIPNTS